MELTKLVMMLQPTMLISLTKPLQTFVSSPGLKPWGGRQSSRHVWTSLLNPE